MGSDFLLSFLQSEQSHFLGCACIDFGRVPVDVEVAVGMRTGEGRRDDRAELLEVAGFSEFGIDIV